MDETHSRSAISAEAGSSSVDTDFEAAARLEITVALVEPRALIRECLTDCLRRLNPAVSVVPFPTVANWLEAIAHNTRADMVALGIGDRGTDINKELHILARSAMSVPVVVISDREDPNHILAALDAGAKGVIPTTVSLVVAVEAMRLVRAGGTFVPASSLTAARNSLKQLKSDSKPRATSMFTERQAEVAEAVRHGKPNKIIAYELNMRESTVKVHIRNIMRKLHATNRTQVACIFQSLTDGEEAYSNGS